MATIARITTGSFPWSWKKTLKKRKKKKEKKTKKRSQLLDKGMQGDEDAASGLAYVTDLMIRFEMIERRLRLFDSNKQHGISSKLITSVRTSTVNLYTKIYKYQVCIIQHYGSGAVKRFFKDVAGITEWKNLQQEMETMDKEIAKKQRVLCNDVVLKISEALDKFDAQNMRQHTITQQATKVRQTLPRHKDC